MEVGREDERLRFQPLHDGRSFRLPGHVIKFKSIWEVSIQVIVVTVFPLKEKSSLGFIDGM